MKGATYHFKTKDGNIVATLTNGESHDKNKVYKAAKEMSKILGKELIMVKRDISIKETIVCTITTENKN